MALCFFLKKVGCHTGKSQTARCIVGFFFDPMTFSEQMAIIVGGSCVAGSMLGIVIGFIIGWWFGFQSGINDEVLGGGQTAIPDTRANRLLLPAAFKARKEG